MKTMKTGGRASGVACFMAAILLTSAPSVDAQITVGEVTIPIPKHAKTPQLHAEWVEGFPIPRAALRNNSLGGATTLAPGRNYTLRVYDVNADMRAIIAFYKHHLPEGRYCFSEEKGGRLFLSPA